MHIAFLGFGLIGGSVARAVRTDARRSMAGRWPAGRRRATGPTQARADGVLNVVATSPNTVDPRRRHRRPRRARDRMPGADRPARRPVALGAAGRRGRDRRREHEGGDRRACRRARACASSAATRWPGSTPQATAPPSRTCSSGGRGSSCPARTRGRRTSSGSRPSRTRAGPCAVRLDAADHDRAVAGHQPPAAGRRRGPRGGRRRPRRRTGRPRRRSPPAAGATRPASPAAIRRWAPRSWPPTRRRSRPGCATCATSSTSGSPSSTELEPDARTAPTRSPCATASRPRRALLGPRA